MRNPLLALALVPTLGCAAAGNPAARYVFLFIGDGMGLNQVALTEAYQASEVGDTTRFFPVSFTRFPVLGTTTTNCATRRITESSAAATAIATGSKAEDGTLGITPGTHAPLRTVAEEAHAAGRKVGILTTVSVDHATPAGFYAHVPNRSAYNTIGMQLAASGFDVFAGGGFLAPMGESGNVWDALRDSGYTVVRGRAELAARRPGGRIVALPPADPAITTLPWNIDRAWYGADQPTLSDFVRETARLLEPDPDGFFLMAEAGRIDMACHANDARSAIGEVQALDSAVRVALSFAERHPGEVLIIVTGDHETGGLALGNRGLNYNSNTGVLRHQVSSHELLAAHLRPALAIADSLGSIDSTFGRIALFTGLGVQPGLELTDAERARLVQAWSADRPGGVGTSLANAAVALVDAKAGVGWTTGAHTSQPVPVYAWGAGAEGFGGRIDNTDIARLLRQSMRVGPEFPARPSVQQIQRKVVRISPFRSFRRRKR